MRSRIAKVTYGLDCDIRYQPELPDHRERVSITAYTAPSGLLYIRNAFDIILPKVCLTLAFSCRMRELTFVACRTRQSRRPKNSRGPYQFMYSTAEEVRGVRSVSVVCYRGLVELPKWKDVDSSRTSSFTQLNFFLYLYSSDNYTSLCRIEIDVSEIPAVKCATLHGRGVYFALNCEVILIFGLTEIKAQAAWLDRNVRISFTL